MRRANTMSSSLKVSACVVLCLVVMAKNARSTSDTCAAVNTCRPCASHAASGFDVPTVCNNTCVFQERAAHTEVSYSPNGLAPTNAAWNTRKLSVTIGNPVACGASLNPSTNIITLDPGTYVISGMSLAYKVDATSVRLSQVDDAGAYVSTVALGSNQWSRLGNSHNNLQTMFYDHELWVTAPGTKYKLEHYFSNAVEHFQWGIAPGHGYLASYAETYGVGAQVTVRRKPDDYVRGSTCEFKETVSSDKNIISDVAPTGYAWNDRKLNQLAGGDSAACGAALDVDTNTLTLQPGTYRIRGSTTTALSDMTFARLAKFDSGSGAYVNTVALGSTSFCRTVAGNNFGTTAASVFLPQEITVTETSKFKLQTFFTISSMWAWGLAAGYRDGEAHTVVTANSGYGESVSVHSQLSVVKLRGGGGGGGGDDDEIGTTCVFRETVEMSPSVLGFGSVVAGWNDRILNDAIGNANACGATLDTLSGVFTLAPGTYVMEAIGLAHYSKFLTARLAVVDDQNAYVKTLAMGSGGFSRPTSAHTNEHSFIHETPEFVVATPTRFKIQVYHQGENAASVYVKGVAPGWKGAQMTATNVGESVGVGSQVSVRKVR